MSIATRRERKKDGLRMAAADPSITPLQQLTAQVLLGSPMNVEPNPAESLMNGMNFDGPLGRQAEKVVKTKQDEGTQLDVDYRMGDDAERTVAESRIRRIASESTARILV